MYASVLAVHEALGSLLAQTDNSEVIANENKYVLISYILVVVVIVAYAAFTIRRGRALGRQLPPEQRRWM